ncbi:MAG: DNA/RNA non-specific endonuclease [bacterium]
MIDIPSLRPETRCGIPTADQLLFNREYIVGYSYLFRQPRWAMEVIDPENRRVEVERIDSFRPDLRVPERFRAELDDYKGSGFDRGHLIASADRRAEEILNSETFLLTNMSPQKPKFNRGIWKQLEEAVRDLANLYVEVYTVCGPLFDVGKKIEIIGQGPVKIPVPHSFFKSILAEKVRGKLDLWSFIFPNEESNDRLKNFLVPTTEVEIRSGLSLWDRLRGESADNLKSRKGRMWSLSSAKRAAQKRAAEREEQNG